MDEQNESCILDVEDPSEEIPWRDRVNPVPGQTGVHGRILRCDTTGEEACFSLRYCDCGHNGGLCAALPGPVFLVNVENGVRSASAHRPLEPGRHYLAGLYDGRRIALCVDGEIAAEQEASGKLRKTCLPVWVGRIQEGGGGFSGSVRRVRIWKRSLSRSELEEHANRGENLR